MDSYVFEERWLDLKQTDLTDNTSFITAFKVLKEEVWPRITKSGGLVYCLLRGMIGTPPNRLVQITRYPDVLTWEREQFSFNQYLEDIIETEEIRLLKAITSRPKDPFPIEDRRTIYTYRRFYINPENIEEVAHLSYNGVWPLYEKWDVITFGLFTPIDLTKEQEVILISGYKNLGHWEETRVYLNKSRPEAIEEKIWNDGLSMLNKRSKLIKRTTVSTMWSHYFSCDPLKQ